MIIHNESRWGYIFVDPNGKVPYSDLMDILRLALDLYPKRHAKADFKGEYCEGQVRKTSRYQALGSFTGLRFEAEMDTDKGKANLSFLVKEYTAHLN